jgi:hypothetical protein
VISTILSDSAVCDPAVTRGVKERAMATDPNGPKFSQKELAAIDHLIEQVKAQGGGADSPVPLTTPVAAIVAQAVIATVAVLCVKVPEDDTRIQQIGDLAAQLKSSTTLDNLIQLRERALKSM